MNTPALDKQFHFAIIDMFGELGISARVQIFENCFYEKCFPN